LKGIDDYILSSLFVILNSNVRNAPLVIVEIEGGA
jgi:hypothetical protein